MKLTILFTLITLNVCAQKITNTLEGYFKNTKENELYNSIYLDGKGHALINNSYQAEYFQKDDRLYLFPDKSVFILKIDKNKLKGESTWVDKLTFKETKIPESEEINPLATYYIAPELLHEFYKQNFIEGTDETNFSLFSDEVSYSENAKKLCDQGLTSACGAQFGLLYIEALGGIDLLLDENLDKNIKENKVLEQLANKMIGLGDIRGYALLGSYYYAIGKEDLAFETYQIGSDNGDQTSASILLQTELNQLIEEETNQENTVEIE